MSRKINGDSVKNSLSLLFVPTARGGGMEINMKNQAFRDFALIENEFFDIEEGIASVRLHFGSPDEIFDVNCLSKIPIFNDDFDEWLQSVFRMIPSKYQIALEISFDDMNGFSREQLDDIFRKNLMLAARSASQSVQRRNYIAVGLIGAGLFSFIAMMLTGKLWNDESFWHEVFFYFLDIATTVLFWEAAGILLVENREHRIMAKAYWERFSSISFFETKTP